MSDNLENFEPEYTNKNSVPKNEPHNTQNNVPFPYIAKPYNEERNETIEEQIKEIVNNEAQRIELPNTARFDPMTGKPLITNTDFADKPRNPQSPRLPKREYPEPVSFENKYEQYMQPISNHRKNNHSTAKAVAGGTFGGIAASALLVATLVGGNVLHVNLPSTSNSTPNTTINASTITASEDATVAEAVAAKCLPSVVSVNVSTKEGEGIGSGVVLDKSGNIITNWHVAGEADIITVKVGDKNYPATLVGGDESSDIAVINIEPDGDELTPIEIGDSSQLVVGDWVMTLGSPLGLDQSASSGIVSALYRNTTMQSNTYTNTLYTNLIQVDAAINGGNSGGALVNEQGQLVGINTLYANGSGIDSFSGIGFAIPGNYAIDIANKVINGEKITHAYLGASCATVNEQNAKANRLRLNYGAYVAEISADSPAEKAGLKVGDIITKIGDTTIESADDYILAIRSHTQGEKVTIEINRNGENINLEATLDSDEKLQEQQQKEKEEYQKWQEEQMNQMQQYQDTWPWDSYNTYDPYSQMFEMTF